MRVNGMDLIVNPGTLEEAFDLKAVVFEALQGKANVSFTDSDLVNLFDAEVSGGNVGAILDMLMSVVSSSKVQASLFNLSKRCAIGEGQDKVVITKDFFEPVENRKHYYPIMLEILKANLLPFFQGLGLESLVPEALKGKLQKSK